MRNIFVQPYTLRSPSVNFLSGNGQSHLSPTEPFPPMASCCARNKSHLPVPRHTSPPHSVLPWNHTSTSWSFPVLEHVEAISTPGPLHLLTSDPEPCPRFPVTDPLCHSDLKASDAPWQASFSLLTPPPPQTWPACFFPTSFLCVISFTCLSGASSSRARIHPFCYHSPTTH